jgi:hypothetical protein
MNLPTGRLWPTPPRGIVTPAEIAYADQDFPFSDFGSEGFCKALKAKKVEARAVKVAGRNHIDVLTRIPRDGDPCARALVEFVTAHSGR